MRGLGLVPLVIRDQINDQYIINENSDTLLDLNKKKLTVIC